MELPYDPVIPLLGIHLKKPKTVIQKSICAPVFIAVSFTTVKIWKQLKWPSADEWTKQLRYVHIMEYYPAIKKKEIVPFATAWLDLESIMLSETFHFIEHWCLGKLAEK